MELRRVADTLLRSQSCPLSSIPVLQSSIRWTTKAQLEYSHSSNRPAQRCLSTTSRRYALKNIPITTAAPPRPASGGTTSSTPSTPSTPSAIADLSATLGWTSGMKKKPPFPKIVTNTFGKLEEGSSADDLLRGLRERGEKTRRGGSGIDVNRMLDPTFPDSGSGSDPAKGWMIGTAEETMIHKSKRVPMNLGPSTGRTVTVGSTGIDIGRGFRLLEQACARNKVRSDFTKQRYHERGGLKRKRLGRERWRKKFMAGFKATISRVKALKNQGW